MCAKNGDGIACNSCRLCLFCMEISPVLSWFSISLNFFFSIRKRISIRCWNTDPWMSPISALHTFRRCILRYDCRTSERNENCNHVAYLERERTAMSRRNGPYWALRPLLRIMFYPSREFTSRFGDPNGRLEFMKSCRIYVDRALPLLLPLTSLSLGPVNPSL